MNSLGAARSPRARAAAARAAAPARPALTSKIQLHEQRPIIALLRLELVDLVEHAGDRLLRCAAEHAVVEHAAVPAAEEDRRVSGARELAPEAREPMPLAGLAPVESGRMDHKVARIERGRELPQRKLLRRALRPFEQDDRAAAMRDLRQLELGQMLAQRRERTSLDRLLLRVRQSSTSRSTIEREVNANDAARTTARLQPALFWVSSARRP